ncbi:hypothetical protein FXW78_22925 [Rhodococcus opacus]|nr:hypothetical protein [Rhodococcus opacus]
MLDSDRIEDYLMRDALASGVYDDLLTAALLEGSPLRPRGVVTLVHRESTRILDAVQQRCV